MNVELCSAFSSSNCSIYSNAASRLFIGNLVDPFAVCVYCETIVILKAFLLSTSHYLIRRAKSFHFPCSQLFSSNPWLVDTRAPLPHLKSALTNIDYTQDQVAFRSYLINPRIKRQFQNLWFPEWLLSENQ